ncbi:MAG: carboxypeptidase regulatory-like domain-containing protein, partial [Pyrinomonadaceae bacterium]
MKQTLARALRLLFALSLLSPLAAPAQQLAVSAAQQPTGSLRGVVKDEQGGVIVGATVTLIDASGAEKAAATNQEGVYTFTGIAPGHYLVRAVQGGFAQFENADVNVTGTGRERLDITLAIALTEESVSVTDKPGVNTEADNNQSALVIKDKDLDALPDDPDDLAAALQALAGPAAGPNGGQIYVDGFSNGQIPPKDAIREIRINQNPFSAEFDQIGFGRIEILTRPGSDKYRGQTFFSFSDESLNSRDPFANRRAPSQGRNFGGNFSGPIQKKKSSFFLNFEKRDTDNNSIINTEIVDPITFAPEPYVNTIIVPARRTSFSPRIDYAINKNNTLVARYNYTHTTQRNTGASEQVLDVDPYFGVVRTSASNNTEQSIQVTETAILTPTIINETRFQFERSTRNSGGDISFPVLNVAGAFTAGGSSSAPAHNTNTQWELQNYTSFVRGLHSLKAGARLRDVHINDFSQGGFNGTFVFAGTQLLSSTDLFRAVQAGVPGAIPTQLNLSGGGPNAGVQQFDVGAFIQDDWRVRPNFTVSAGLRYENQTNISSAFNFAPRLAFAYSLGSQNSRPKTVLRGGAGIFYSRVNESLTLSANRFNGTNTQRFIITQRPVPTLCGADPSLTPGCATSDQIANIVTQNTVARAILSAYPRVPTIDQLAPFRSALTTNMLASDITAPYSIQSTFSVERQLPHNMTATATYINTRTLHMLRSRNINAPLNGVRPLGDAAGNLYIYESSGILNQNQLSINVNTRLNPKFTIFSNYTLNKANSDTDGSGSFPANNYDLSGEYGRASSDIRHRFTLGGSVDSPWWGLRFNPFVTALSGRPFNITTGIDNNGDTTFNDRPAFADAQTAAFDLRSTAWGNFDIRPKPGQTIIPRNYGQASNYISVNMRITKTVGFGTRAGGRANVAANGARGQGTTAAAQGGAQAR